MLLINDHFRSVITKEDSSRHLPRIPHTINPIQVTSQGVQKQLLNLRPDRALGQDEIPPLRLYIKKFRQY